MKTISTLKKQLSETEIFNCLHLKHLCKKLFSVFAFAFTMILSNSFAQQIPNPGMESWIPQTAYSDPTGWQTPNLLNDSWLGSNPVSVFQEQSPDVNSGTYAMKITTFAYKPGTFDLTSSLPNDTLGFAFTGKINPTGSPTLVKGYPETIRFTALYFYAKYVPVLNDSAVCKVNLSFKNNLLATGTVTIGSTPAYKGFVVYLNSIQAGTPDSAFVVFQSSKDKNPQIGSALWVDDLHFSLTGINEQNMLKNAIKVYPNPTTDNITLAARLSDQTLSSVEVYDVTGRKVDAVAVQNNKTILSTSNYAGGLYSYNAYNEKKELIGIGKFSVAK